MPPHQFRERRLVSALEIAPQQVRIGGGILAGTGVAPQQPQHVAQHRYPHGSSST